MSRTMAVFTALITIALIAGTTGCGGEGTPAASATGTPVTSTPSDEGNGEAAFRLTSTAFAGGQSIPRKYTCDGDDISPPLDWSDAPPGTAGFALILDDPDAPAGTWVHWVLYNLPPETRALPESVAPDTELADGSRHGKNSWGRPGYGGPCPPGGTHRYYFKLYALDTVLELGSGASKDQLLRAMEGHIIGQAELMGTYRRG